ncbi:MAG: PorP/SprF family type IX secretion system membrane protein [Flavobacteriales bacterium]
MKITRRRINPLVLGLMAALVLGSKPLAQAQENPSISSYGLNEQYVSPSNTGIYDYLSAGVSYRSQWAKVADGSKTFFATANSPIDDMHGLGLMLFSDKFGLVKQSGVCIDYSYRIPLGLDYNLAFGIGPKIYQYTFGAGANTIVPVDPAFSKQDESAIAIDARVGASVFSDRFLFSLSADNLAQSKVQTNTLTTKRNHLHRELKLYGHGHFVLEQNKNIAIEPSFLLKSKMYEHYQVDFAIDVSYKDLVYAGVQYKLDDAFALRAGLRSKELIVGYQFELIQSELKNVQKTNHEIFIGIRIFNDRSSQNNRWYDRHKEAEWIGKDSVLKTRVQD